MPFDLVSRTFACLLLGLRVAPMFALAPPFTQIRMPSLFRVLFGLGIAACLVAGNPSQVRLEDAGPGVLVMIGARELLLGGIFAMAFQLTFGMLYVAGRTIDIQAGFGLALLIDPTSQGQTPLVGTLFAYVAGAAFLAFGGPGDILQMLQASLQAIPLGTGTLHPEAFPRLVAFLGAVSFVSFGVAGGAILILFLADGAIALISRTVPQMNVLVLGFQVKTLLLLLVLPVTLGASGAMLARLSALTLEAIPGLL